MGDAIVALVLFAGFVGVVAAAARIVDRGARRGARERTRSERGTPWTVATLSAYPNRGATRVVVRRITEGGRVLDEYLVAEIPAGHEDWAAMLGQAKAEAASRAALLNSEP